MTKALLMMAALLLMPLPALSQGMQSSDDRDSSHSYGRRSQDIEELLRSIDDGGSSGSPRRGGGFLLRSGDSMVAVRCDPRDSMRSCVDATLMLLDRARTMVPAGGGSSSGGGGGGASPGETPPTR